jgi:hypothetical protein
MRPFGRAGNNRLAQANPFAKAEREGIREKQQDLV